MVLVASAGSGTLAVIVVTVFRALALILLIILIAPGLSPVSLSASAFQSKTSAKRMKTLLFGASSSPLLPPLVVPNSLLTHCSGVFTVYNFLGSLGSNEAKNHYLGRRIPTQVVHKFHFLF